MLPAGFEPAIPAKSRLQTYALDRAATTVVSSADFSITKIVEIVSCADKDLCDGPISRPEESYAAYVRNRVW